MCADWTGFAMVNTVKAALRVIVYILVICLCHETIHAASEKERCDDPCGKSTAWNEFNVFELKVTMPQKTGYESWHGRFDKESSDIQIDVETFDGQRTTHGKILLVGGRVMATQGPITEPGYEIDALDAPVLEQRLVTSLLGRVLPDGPTRVEAVRTIDFTDEKTGIQFATPSAQGFIPAPWHVTGEVKLAGPDDIKYQLTLTATIKQQSPASSQGYVATFTGRLSKEASVKIDDALPLEGWNLFGLGVQKRKGSGGTTFDYSAAPATTLYKIVADIRKKIAEDDYPGEPDPSNNFTGFWKEDCEQAFGLQIMPYGKDGKYSVTFCGPGGCGTAGEDGKNTFITKDPDYEVVSESKIKVRNVDNGWDTYYRCTRDTHLILKYKQQ